jgi:hypothetical protein
VPITRNRFIQPDDGTTSVNQELEGKAQGAGRDQGLHHQAGCPDDTPITPEFVIGAYRWLFEIQVIPHVQERPADQAHLHRQRDSIEAHLTIVFAALSVGRWIEHTTGWSIRKFVRTARRYRTVEIQVGGHTITAADPLPADLNKPSTASTASQMRTDLSKVRHPTRIPLR